MLAKIFLFETSFDLNPFIYDFSDYKETFEVWKIVKVPFWEDEKLGFIYEKIDKNEIIVNYEIKKWIILDVEKPLFKTYFKPLFSFLLKENSILPHNISWLFILKSIREQIIKNKFSFDTKNTYNYTYNTNISLTLSQKETLENTKKSTSKHIMMYWVTWSWKTEIYINLIKNALDKWKQSLLMVPEIILTSQLSKRIEKVFWKDVLIITSSVTQAKKREAWKDIFTWKAKIIISTRSWIFYPFENLWLIIVDEEHDNSFISNETPRYDTYKIIEKLSKINNNLKVIYGSWTPKVNHFYDFLNWKWEIFYLLDEIKK